MSKLIINEVQNSGYKPGGDHEDDYRSEIYKKIGEPVMGAVSPLPKSPVVFGNSIGWRSLALEYGNPEIQFNKHFDTFSCVVYGIAKATCYFLYKQYGIKTTIAEMYNAFFAGVIPRSGTTVRKGMESFRKYGWVKDSEYPFTADMTADDFFGAPPKRIKLLADKTLTEWDFHWEIVPKTLEGIIEQYKRTPVVLSGYAWAYKNINGENIYYDGGRNANHVFVGLEEIADGNNLCDDTYPKNFKNKENLEKDELFKTLHKSFNYGSAHCCWVTPTAKSKITLINFIKNMFEKISRDVHGGFWFIKNNRKQKITDWTSMLGSIIDEVGVKKNNLTDDELSTIPDFKFFGR